MQLLALDFDGVISDSAPECFAVAVDTYTAIRPDSRHAKTAQALREARSEPGLLLRIQSDPLYQSFLELMPLGNRAEDFGVALGILEEGSSVETQEDYDRAWKAHASSFLEGFHERFYQCRDAFKSEAHEVWSSLLSPYPEFVSLLKRRSTAARLAIATAKDRSSVLELLAAYELEALFDAELILDKDTGRSKRAHLEALAERSGLAFSEITFVDDKVNHLDGVAPLGVRCALAAWGYNGARERALALERGYLVCALADVEGQLFG